MYFVGSKILFSFFPVCLSVRLSLSVSALWSFSEVFQRDAGYFSFIFFLITRTELPVRTTGRLGGHAIISARINVSRFYDL